MSYFENSNILPPLTSVVSASAASLEVRNFLLSLGERWVELAGFLGFSGEEVGAITEAHASSTEHQVSSICKIIMSSTITNVCWVHNVCAQNS